MIRSMTPEAAKRCALAASGFSAGRPQTVTRRHLKKVFRTLGLVQIDSVARVVRSHYLPFFSRLGPYSLDLLDSLLHQSERMGVEYWMHEAAYAPPATIALADGRRAEWWLRDYGQRDPESGPAFLSLMRDLEAELAVAPGSARELAGRVSHEIPERPRNHWGWNPSRVKSGLEALFRAGRISVASRNPAFERVFAPPAAVHPGLPVPELRFGPPDDPDLGLRSGAARLVRGSSGVEDDVPALVRIAAAALGVATYACLADYFRLPVRPVRAAVTELLRTGELQEVDVAGVRAFRWHATAVPRRVEATALLAPFDPLVFNRPRISWLFGFEYRIEIYTPAHARVHGYYVLPFLLGQDLVGRVDLAADRSRDALIAHRIHWEPGHRHERELMAELHRMREWLGLSSLVVGAG